MLICPLKGSKFEQLVDPETINSINTWQDCAAKCQTKTTCEYWNWEDADGGNPNTCTLMADYLEDLSHPNFVGGNSKCNEKSKFVLCFYSANNPASYCVLPT